MAGKFNKTKVASKPDAVTYEGADAFEKNLEEDWLNNLFSNMLENRYYETSDAQMERYIDLTNRMLEKYGPKFVARAAHFARNQLGMRSISQVTAALLNSEQFEGKRDFYKNYFHRPDDVSEIFAILDYFNEKRSHALVRGAADYISGLGAYQMDKYAMRRKDWSMIDLINVTHAKGDIVNKFYNGTLEKAGTWEQKISAAETEEEKSQNWIELVESNSLGYLALLRNLNNIMKCDIGIEWLENVLCPQLTNEYKIKKSLVFPYQIYTAFKNLDACPLCLNVALDKAFRIAIGNIPGLEGNSLVVLDVSGSMESLMSGRSNMTIKEVCACYAAAIYLANPDSEFIKFAEKARMFNYNRLDNVFNIIDKMQNNDNCGVCTDIVPVWQMLDKHYNRIFLFSDMQVMDRNNFWGDWVYDIDAPTPMEAMNDYMKTFGRTHVYSFDCANYTSQINNPRRGNLTMLTALNGKVFEMLAILEEGCDIVDYINEKYADVI